MKEQEIKSRNHFLDSLTEGVKDNLGIIAGLVIFCIFLSVATKSFATTKNFFNVIRQVTINLYLTCGMMVVIVYGGIDLSVGSVIAVSGCISAGMVSWLGLPSPIAILIGILCGTLIGAFNGLVSSRTIIPPFIITLATMNIGRGIARVYTNAKTVIVDDKGFLFLGTGNLFGIPIQLFEIVIIVFITWFILNRTTLGRHIYATGDNAVAAEYSGINTRRIGFFVFAFSGLLASIAGILSTARTFAGTMTMGQGAEMDAIAAVVLGGVSMSGGVGRISGAVIGAIIIGVLSNGMNLLGINSSWQYIVQGIVILIAVFIDFFKKKKSK